LSEISYQKFVYTLVLTLEYGFDTVANFSPEHSGTEKDQRGYPLCLKSQIFLFLLLKVLIHEKSLLERIFISRFSSVISKSFAN
jgi:hypothetical protein